MNLEDKAKHIIETVCDHIVSYTDIDINDYEILVKKLMLMNCKFCNGKMVKEVKDGIWLMCKYCRFFYNPESKEEYLEP